MAIEVPFFVASSQKTYPIISYAIAGRHRLLTTIAYYLPDSFFA